MYTIVDMKLVAGEERKSSCPLGMWASELSQKQTLSVVSAARCNESRAPFMDEDDCQSTHTTTLTQIKPVAEILFSPYFH